MHRWTPFNVLFWSVHLAALAACAAVLATAGLEALRARATPAAAIDLQRWATLLANTAVVSGTAVALALPAGVIVGALLFRTNLFGRRLGLAGLLIAVCVPLYVSGTALLAVAGIDNLLESRWGAGWLYGTILSPLAALLIGCGLLAAPRPCEDAAALDAGPLGVLWHVSLPCSRWHVTVAALLVLLVSATDMFLTDVLQVRTFAEEIYTQNALHGAAVNTLLLGMPMTALLMVLFGVAWCRRPAPAPVGAAEPGPFDLGRWRVPLAGLLGTGLAALLWILLAPLLREVGGIDGLIRAARTVWPESRTSLWTCPAAATLCAVLAPGLAWMFLQVRGLRGAVLVVLLGLLCLPGPAVGIVLIRLLNRQMLGGLYDSPVVLVIGLAMRFLPLAVLLVTPAVERLPREIVDNARLDGAATAALHRHMIWPLCRRRIAIAWFVVLVFAFGETACCVLIAPAGHTPLAVRFFTLIHYGIYQEAAAVVILTLLATLPPSAAVVALCLWRRTP